MSILSYLFHYYDYFSCLYSNEGGFGEILKIWLDRTGRGDDVIVRVSCMKIYLQFKKEAVDTWKGSVKYISLTCYVLCALEYISRPVIPKGRKKIFSEDVPSAYETFSCDMGCHNIQ